MFFANKCSNARGVAILFDVNIQCEVKKQICDKNGVMFCGFDPAK